MDKPFVSLVFSAVEALDFPSNFQLQISKLIFQAISAASVAEWQKVSFFLKPGFARLCGGFEGRSGLFEAPFEDWGEIAGFVGIYRLFPEKPCQKRSGQITVAVHLSPLFHLALSRKPADYHVNT